MRGSWKIGTFADIGVYVHWSFPLLLVWVVAMNYAQGSPLPQMVTALCVVLAIFGCVVLHEFGHALTAKRFGIRTRDITLLPIGGLARLERMPEDPIQELLVALAGPAVNVVIACILLLVVLLGGTLHAVTQVDFTGGGFVVTLLVANVFLVVFNMLPAFPMDGGRVLRALLAKATGDYVQATQIAATVGQVLAVGLGILGLFVNPFLMLIALFVYVGAQGEARFVQMRAAFHGVPVKAAMITEFHVLSPDDSVDTAVGHLLAGSQQDFPVVQDGKVLGILARRDLVKTLREAGGGVRVEDSMSLDPGFADDTEMLGPVFERMQLAGVQVLPVMHKQQIVGLLTLENIGELLMVTKAVQAQLDATSPRHDAARQ
jgi:Zn-dependent protease/CBS domain-containing protein